MSKAGVEKPDIITRTIHYDTMIYAESPDWYHWFRFVVPREVIRGV